MTLDFSHHTHDTWISDIFDIPEQLNISCIIVHQVNCFGIMGAGIALTIKQKYPVVYEKYREACYKGNFKPGMIQPVRADKNLVIINLAGQKGYGNGNETIVEAHREAWPKVQAYVNKQKLIPMLFAPAFIGCGLAGGNPAEVIPIAEQACPTIIWVDREGPPAGFNEFEHKGRFIRK